MNFPLRGKHFRAARGGCEENISVPRKKDRAEAAVAAS
jgi:hypothetical protein